MTGGFSAAYPPRDSPRAAQPITPRSISTNTTQPPPCQRLARPARAVPGLDRLRGRGLGCGSLMQLSDELAGAIQYSEHIDPRRRSRRRAFAVLRILEVSLAVLGFLTLLLTFTAPASPGHTNRGMYLVAWSTPRIFAIVAAGFIGAAFMLHLLSVPLKRAWTEDLRGWIT